MARAIEVGVAKTTPTTASTIDITDTDFDSGTPVGYLLISAGNPDQATGRNSLTVGAADGTTQYGHTVYARHNTASMLNRQDAWSNGVFCTLSQNDNEDAYATHNSFITNGIRLNQTVEVDAFDGHYMSIMFGGSGVTNFKVMTMTVDAAQDAAEDLTGIGFDPNLAIYVCNNIATRRAVTTTDNDGDNSDGAFSMGFACYDGTSVMQRGFVWYSDNTAADADIRREILPTTQVVGNIDDVTGDTTGWRLEVDSFGTGEIQHTVRDAAGDSALVMVICIELDTNDLWVGDVDILTTDTGNTSYTDPGFEPNCLLTIQNRTDTQGSEVSATDESENVAISVLTSNASGTKNGITASFTFEDATANSNTETHIFEGPTTGGDGYGDMYCPDSRTNQSDDAIDYEVDMVSMDASGWTWNVQNAPATNSKVLVLAIGDTPIGGAGPSPGLRTLSLTGVGI